MLRILPNYASLHPLFLLISASQNFCFDSLHWAASWTWRQRQNSSLISGIIYSGEVSGHVMRKLEQPYEEVHMGRKWGLLPTASINVPAMRVSQLEVNLPVTLKPSNDYQHGWHLNCKLMRLPKPEPPKLPLNSWPQKLYETFFLSQ